MIGFQHETYIQEITLIKKRSCALVPRGGIWQMFYTTVFLNFTQEKSVTCMDTLQPSWPGSTRVLVVTGGLVALLDLVW